VSGLSKNVSSYGETEGDEPRKTFESCVEDLEMALETYMMRTEGKFESQAAHNIWDGVATAKGSIDDWREGGGR
jgi:hypothetical protein